MKTRFAFTLFTTIVGMGATVAACSAAPPGEDSASQSSATVSYSPVPPTTPAAFGAADLVSAYNVPVLLPASATIAIIVQDGSNAGADDPNFDEDLAQYRLAYGLPACTQANGCLRKLNENGTSTPSAGGLPIDGELTAAALDMVSAACPDCKLLVIDMTGFLDPDYTAAVKTAASQGAKAVVFGGVGNHSTPFAEEPDDALVDSTFASSGATIFAAPFWWQGQLRYPQESPASITVGATALDDNGPAATRFGWEESATSASGAYTSCWTGIPKPTWQHDTGCTGRMIVDMAATDGPVWTFNTFGGDVGWVPQTNLTVATALVAGIFAQTGVAGTAASYPYTNASLLNDVTTGSEATNASVPSYFVSAEVGYDGPTGNGTPNGAAMAGYGETMIVTSGERLTVSVAQTTPTSVVVNVSPYSWPNPAEVTVTASNLPPNVTAKWVQTRGYIAPVYGIAGAMEFTALPGALIGEQRSVTITGTSGTASYSTVVEVSVVPCAPLPATMCTGSCGALPDGCGGTLPCGGCPTGQSCNADNYCSAPPPPPVKCASGLRNCGGYCAKLCE